MKVNSFKTEVLGIKQKNKVSPSGGSSTSYRAGAVERMYNSIKNAVLGIICEKESFPGNRFLSF